MPTPLRFDMELERRTFSDSGEFLEAADVKAVLTSCYAIAPLSESDDYITAWRAAISHIAHRFSIRIEKK